jgi:hypothetical protein
MWRAHAAGCAGAALATFSGGLPPVSGTTVLWPPDAASGGVFLV